MVPFGILVVLLVFWKLKAEWIECQGEKFDLVGSVLYGIGLLFIMYGFSDLNNLLGAVLLILGIIAMFIFLRWELKVESPVFNVRLFSQNITFTLSSLAALINYSATFAVALLLSYYLQYIKGLDPLLPV